MNIFSLEVLDRDKIDVEKGLLKVREAAKLIKDSKSRLAKIENEFREIEKEIGEDNAVMGNVEEATEEDNEQNINGEYNVDDIPF